MVDVLVVDVAVVVVVDVAVVSVMGVSLVYMAAVDDKGSVVIVVVGLVVVIGLVVVVDLKVVVVIMVCLVYLSACALSVIYACAPTRNIVNSTARIAMMVAFFVIVHPFLINLLTCVFGKKIIQFRGAKKGRHQSSKRASICECF